MRIPQFHRITNPKKRRWLVAYARCGTISGSTKITGMDWRNHYHWLHKDEDYKKAFEQAKQIAGDFIEDSIIEAATSGDEVPVIYEGKITGHYQRKSDILRMFVLKARKPEYRDNFAAQSIAGPVNVQIVMAPIPPTMPLSEKVIESGATEK